MLTRVTIKQGHRTRAFTVNVTSKAELLEVIQRNLGRSTHYEYRAILAERAATLDDVSYKGGDVILQEAVSAGCPQAVKAIKPNYNVSVMSAKHPFDQPYSFSVSSPLQIDWERIARESGNTNKTVTVSRNCGGSHEAIAALTISPSLELLDIGDRIYKGCNRVQPLGPDSRIILQELYRAKFDMEKYSAKPNGTFSILSTLTLKEGFTLKGGTEGYSIFDP